MSDPRSVVGRGVGRECSEDSPVGCSRSVNTGCTVSGSMLVVSYPPIAHPATTDGNQGGV